MSKKPDTTSAINVLPTYHVPVLLNDSVDGLDIKPGGIYVDVTFGGGGHSREILRRLTEADNKNGNGTMGHLYSFDQDEDAERNITMDERFTFVRSNFRYLKNWMRFHGVEQIDGLLADLGVSSHHFDDETRGFSFRFDAPLDMRMNKRAGLTAAEILNTYDEQHLADVLYLYGELKNSRKIAGDIVKARERDRISTTLDLLAAIHCKWQPNSSEDGAIDVEPQDKKNLARLFQALRIEANHEMDALKEMLLAATELLKPGGRLSVITYHSLEDRMVKNVIKSGNIEGRRTTDFYGRVTAPLRAVNNKVIVPSNEEQTSNPRSRSAKLRIAVKVGSCAP